MSSPISFSGFNNIDFSVVLNGLMSLASQPLTALQDRQSTIKKQMGVWDQLSSRLSTLNDAVTDLSDIDGLDTFKATSGDPSAVAVSGAGTMAGHFDVIVNELARAQVTASSSTSPDSDTTIVANGGGLTIGGVFVSVTGPSTLQQLASTINGTSGIGVTASVVRSAPGAFRLVLTGRSSGVDNAFTVTNTLSGGTGVSFTDTDGNGVSGDTAADNAVQASDASLLVNNVAVTGTSNTFDDVIPGVSFTVFRKDPTTTVGVDIAADSEALKGKVTAFIDAYNDFVKFANDQATAAAGGDQSSIGRDSLMRGLRNQLRSTLTGLHAGTTYTRLAEVGVEFTQTGTLQLNDALFNEAVSDHPDDLKTLFAGAGGAFGALTDVINDYSDAGGLISSAKTRLTQQSSQLDTQIAAMQDRLAVQRAALQAEFTAADNAMKQLNNQSNALANLGSAFQISSSSF